MNLSNLKPAEGAIKTSKRLGRGQGSTMGGTSTRGHKGAGSRAGNKIKQGFEGGQMPLQRRMPKIGFKNFFREEYKVLNLSQLQEWADKHKSATCTLEEMVKTGVKRKVHKIKILGKGELKTSLKIQAHAVSATAQKAIEAAGGSIEIVKA